MLYFLRNLFLTTGFNVILPVGGCIISCAFGLVGLFSKPPPQFGQTFFSMLLTQLLQYVHSKVQIIASSLLFGNFFAQFLQNCLISSFIFAPLYCIQFSFIELHKFVLYFLLFQLFIIDDLMFSCCEQTTLNLREHPCA